MRVIRSAVVQCDDCGKALQRMAKPHTKATKLAERRILRDLAGYAKAKGWQMEGPSVMAGDLCGPCERIARLGSDLGWETA